MIPKIDHAAHQLVAVDAGKTIQIVDEKKSWTGPVMNASITGKVGFITVPLAGTVAVDDTNVTVECELSSMVKNFVGEAKVQAMVEEKVRGLIPPTRRPPGASAAQNARKTNLELSTVSDAMMA